MIQNVERRKSECCWLGGATADSGTAEARLLLLLLQCHSAGDSEVGPRVGTELQVSVSKLVIYRGHEGFLTPFLGQKFSQGTNLDVLTRIIHPICHKGNCNGY